MPALRARVADERGATMVEYGLVLALVAVMAMVGFTFIGNSTNDKLMCTGAAMSADVATHANGDDFYDINGDGAQDDDEPLVSDCGSRDRAR